jgi:hypothetical protein
LLSGEIDQTSHPLPAAAIRGDDRVEKIEAEVTSLRSDIDNLKATFEEFRKQFE